MMYLAGDGVPSDTVAAAGGYAPARFNLGLLYERGLGVEQDDQIALGWFVLAAEAGWPGAIERVAAVRGRLVQLPELPPANRQSRLGLELSWAIVRGLTAGQPEAAEAAAEITPAPATAQAFEDLPVPPIPTILLAEAAEARLGYNHIAVADRVAAGADAFARGEWSQALASLLPAALAGDAQSQYLLYVLHEKGYGVAADLSEAVAWWALAATQGHTETARAIETADPRLDDSQK